MNNVEEAACAMVAEAIKLPVTEREEAAALAFRIIIEGGLFEDYPRAGSSTGARLVARALAEWGNAMKWFVYGCVAPSGQVDCHAAYIHGDNCSFCHRPIIERPKERARLR